MRESFYSESPRIINSASFDIFMEKGKHFMHESIKKIINRTPSLRKFKNYWESACSYWDKRNTIMAKNIKKYAHDFPNSRIVVIAGAEHRYYLRKLLLSDQDGYILKEYWELTNN